MPCLHSPLLFPLILSAVHSSSHFLCCVFKGIACGAGWQNSLWSLKPILVASHYMWCEGSQVVPTVVLCSANASCPFFHLVACWKRFVWIAPVFDRAPSGAKVHCESLPPRVSFAQGNAWRSVVCCTWILAKHNGRLFCLFTCCQDIIVLMAGAMWFCTRKACISKKNACTVYPHVCAKLSSVLFFVRWVELCCHLEAVISPVLFKFRRKQVGF